ncbi:MAG: glycosyltransferase family 4 protein [Bacteroidota bacterium]
MKNILFIHQSAELYGSDKTLLLLVTQFKAKGINPIVVLPQNGPLLTILQENKIHVILAPVLKISRTMFGFKNMLSLPFQISSSIKIINEACKNNKIDLVYSNTLAVLIGLIYARRNKIKHIWHVHEIIESPQIVKKIFKKLISLKVNSKIIFNSYATQAFWENEQAGKTGSVVVWNGVSKEREPINNAIIEDIRTNLFDVKSTDIVIALVGRINKWKGQKLLLEAFKKIVPKADNLKLIFVGSPPPNQEIYLDDLKIKIVEDKMQDQVRIIPFQNNIWNIWQSVDIAVVPSTEPEPFGLVAIEAMLCGKPVIAANHGGLKEIVVQNETGILFEPNQVLELEKALSKLILEKDTRELMGKKGYERAIADFTLEQYVTKIKQICLNI